MDLCAIVSRAYHKTSRRRACRERGNCVLFMMLPPNLSDEFQIGELIAEISTAFDGVAREDGTTLHEAIAIDDWKSAEECLAARRLDTEQRWQDVPEMDIIKGSSVASFLDAKGFRYYLPAFLVCGLKNWNSSTIAIVESFEYCLLHESQKSLRKTEPASIAEKYGFTEAQCKAIAHFLRFSIGEDDESTSQPATTLQAVKKWECFVGDHVS